MSTLQTQYLNEQVTLNNLPALRKTFIIYGLLTILAFVFAFFVNPVFIFVALIPGIGMLIAGLTGVSFMERIVQKFSKKKIVAPQEFTQ